MTSTPQSTTSQSSQTPNDGAKKQSFVMTDEMAAKQQARREAKLAKKAANRAVNGDGETTSGATTPGGSQILRREWKRLPAKERVTEGERSQSFRLLTWNMLAQTLVRRELFPGSDCLRWGERKDMLIQELTAYDGDIICLQEVDRLDHMLPHLPHHKAIRASGPGKLHGLVILYNADKFTYKATRTIYYDEEFTEGDFHAERIRVDVNKETQAETQERRKRWKKARGGTRQTKNIGLMAALEWVDKPGTGIVVGTTHLFWHPDYGYERTRQIFMLLRALKRFRDDVNPDWPVFAAGDFNTSPSEPAYKLMVDPSGLLDKGHFDQINNARVVHTSRDKVEDHIEATLAAEAAKQTAAIEETSSGPAEFVGVGIGEDDEKEEAGESQGEPGLPKNSRRPTEEDGLLSGEELQKLALDVLRYRGLQSLYGTSGWVGPEQKELSYGGRGGQGEEGKDEAAWTSFTPIWRLTLDYIFYLPTPREGPDVKAILLPHGADALEPGLPRKNVCASDHVLLGVEMQI